MQSKNAHHIDQLERDQLGLGFAFGLALACWHWRRRLGGDLGWENLIERQGDRAELDFSRETWRKKLVAELAARIVEKVSHAAELNPPQGNPRLPYARRRHTPPYQLERRWGAP